MSDMTSHQIINMNSADELDVDGFVRSRKRTLLTIFLCVLSGGILLLIIAWKPKVKFILSRIPSSLENATSLLVEDKYGQLSEETIIVSSHLQVEDQSIRYFFHKKIKYIWDAENLTFSRARFLNEETTLSDIIKMARQNNLSTHLASKREQYYGKNMLFIEYQTFWNLIASQARSSLFLAPNVCMVVILLKLMFRPDEARIFGSLIVFFGIAGLYIAAMAILIMEITKWTKSLQEKMITDTSIKVYRNGEVTTVRSSELVPGDIALVHSRSFIEADMVIIDGSAVLSEATVTGEATPVTKTSVPDSDEVFNLEKHKKHVIYSGTQIQQIRGGSELRSLVINTGFNTVRGEMIRTVLYPKPMAINIYGDFIKLLLVFMAFGVASTVWSFIYWLNHDEIGFKGAVFRALDILAFIVPPILPATIISVNSWTKRQLRKYNVICALSNAIPLAGAIDLVCFDKTGTLTEDDISLEAILPARDGKFMETISTVVDVKKDSVIRKILVSCHTLCSDSYGNLSGNPLDATILKAFEWDLVPLSDPCYNYYEMCPLLLVRPQKIPYPLDDEIALMKVFPFESTSKRTTAITTSRKSKSFQMFVKGAPEKVIRLCTSSSVPENFFATLSSHTAQGLRVIAIASKDLHPDVSWKQIHSIPRETLEENLKFVGLVLLHNRLKPETTPTIAILNEVSIPTVMITGDNLSTAICIAGQCGIINILQPVIFVEASFIESSLSAVKHINITYKCHRTNKDLEFGLNDIENCDFAMVIEGETFYLIEKYDPVSFRKILLKSKVLARMVPEQKASAIKALQCLGYTVAMCGDGCNDCGALTAADIGISISSTAYTGAPFISTRKDISCIPSLLKEGRANLESTYVSLKYSISYCFTSVIAILFLASIYTEPTDVQYLVMELLLITVPCITLGFTPSAAIISKELPLKRISHPIHVISIVVFLCIQTALFGWSWAYTQHQDWPQSVNSTEPVSSIRPTYEGSFIIQEMYFSFVASACIFSHGPPHRSHLYNNRVLTAYLVFGTIFWIVSVFVSSDSFLDFMNFIHAPSAGFVWAIFITTIAAAIASFIIENYLLYGIAMKKVGQWVVNKFELWTAHEILEQDIRSGRKWPLLTSNEGQMRLEMTDYSYSFHDEEHSEDFQFGFRNQFSERQRFDASVKYGAASTDPVENIPLQNFTFR